MEAFFAQSLVAQSNRLASRLQQDDAPLKEDAQARSHALDFMARNGPRLDHPRLFVDVTATSQSALHTGIERVVRGVLTQLLESDASPWRVEPVKLVKGRYVRADSYALHLIQQTEIELSEDDVDPRTGDVLLGLDWVADLLPANTHVLDRWRLRGVRMYFVVYDLLPVRQPAWFPPGIAAMHADWLQCIGRYADGLIGISRSVAEDLRRWFDQHPPRRQTALSLGYFYPGSDVAATRPTTGMPKDAAPLLAKLRKVPSFLMVGTIEPRKGHGIVLDAFERLWTTGSQPMLVIVGKEGWMSETIAGRIRALSARHLPLVWLEQASDDYLAELYATSSALIAASEGEGFGLPLVEAAIRGMPVIARDIPVFREVASTTASYFDGPSMESLIAALKTRMADSSRHSESTSQEASAAVLTWKATTCRLRDMLSDERDSQWLAPWQRR